MHLNTDTLLSDILLSVLKLISPIVKVTFPPPSLSSGRYSSRPEQHHFAWTAHARCPLRHREAPRTWPENAPRCYCDKTQLTRENFRFGGKPTPATYEDTAAMRDERAWCPSRCRMAQAQLNVRLLVRREGAICGRER
ncbi:hypothetical protein ACJJTC_012363 [Scirpophaga incertulas]